MHQDRRTGRWDTLSRLPIQRMQSSCLRDRASRANLALRSNRESIEYMYLTMDLRTTLPHMMCN